MEGKGGNSQAGSYINDDFVNWILKDKESFLGEEGG